MLNHSLRGALLASVLALPIASVATAPSLAAPVYQVFTIENNTGQDVAAVYMNPDGFPRFKSEMLGNQILRNGGALTIKLKLDRACTRRNEAFYDVEVELVNGGKFSQSVDVCERRYSFGTKPQQKQPLDSSSVGGPADPVNVPPPPPLPTTTATVLPAAFETLNPYQPLPPNVIASLNAALASQGLASVSCSASSIVKFNVNGRYTACAYPSAAFGAGNYSMTLPGL